MEFVLEIITEFVFEFLGETIGGMSESSYIPKWIRVLILTVLSGLLFILVFAICGDNELALIIFGGLVVLAWLFLVIKALRIKTKKYERTVLESGEEYIGKRSLFGFVEGEIDLSNLGHWTEGKVEISSEKDEKLPRKERIVKLEENENRFLNALTKYTEDKFNYIGNQARNRLVEKLKNKAQTNNGSQLKLIYVQVLIKAYKSEVNYIFKDKVSNKKVNVSEEKVWEVYDEENNKKNQ